MRRFFVVLYLIVLFCTPGTGYAGPQEDYEEAYKLYIAAGTSFAAYNDRSGELATHYLEQDGWKIDHYVQAKGRTGARFLIAQKPNAAGGITYVTAIVGTENTSDVKIDLKVDKVYFAGTNPDEFAVNAAKKDVPNTEPKVHRGFYEFVQSGPAATLRNTQLAPISLIDLLQTDANNKLYLTGHSLGGAAATLSGAQLLSAGINPSQLEVITFGAPAVGNAAFAAKFESTLPLTRVVISGDPATGALQTLVGGYKQFGREIKWTTPDPDPHKLKVYVDLALKNYYDKRLLAVKSGLEFPQPAPARLENRGRVYIAPLRNNLPDTLTADFWYMREALWDEYRQTLPDFVAAGSEDPAAWRGLAAAAGCRWLVIPEAGTVRLKQQKNIYYITLTQTVYDVATGSVVNTTTFSTGTYNLTPLESFIHVFKGMNALRSTWP